MFTRNLYNAVNKFGDTTWNFSARRLNQKWKEQPYHEDFRQHTIQVEKNISYAPN